MDKPKLRILEVLPVLYEGQHMFHLNDPAGIGESVLVSQSAAQIALYFFNGKFTHEEIQEKIIQSSGVFIQLEEIRNLSDSLDNAGLFESDNFKSRLEAVKKKYMESSERMSVNAGTAYPGEEKKLREYFSEIIKEARKKGSKELDGIKALIAPHIDFMRGALTYGFAYGALNPARSPGTIIVLGIGHHVRDHAYIITEKDFSTPFGRVRTDKEFVKRLVGSCGENLIVDQFEHQNEHSVEFQVVFLRYIFGDSFNIVPILCGAFPPPETDSSDPMNDDNVRTFIKALKKEVEGLGDSCLVVAGVDFAHVGPRFGSTSAVDDRLLEMVENSDRYLLAAVCSGDAEEFYQRLSNDCNKFSVCGYAAIYTLLKVLPGLEGELLNYNQAVQPDGSQAVSFSAVAF